ARTCSVVSGWVEPSARTMVAWVPAGNSTVACRVPSASVTTLPRATCIVPAARSTVLTWLSGATRATSGTIAYPSGCTSTGSHASLDGVGTGVEKLRRRRHSGGHGRVQRRHAGGRLRGHEREGDGGQGRDVAGPVGGAQVDRVGARGRAVQRQGGGEEEVAG